jgi:hypothetical protein
MVYFTDATSKFSAQDYGGTLKAIMRLPAALSPRAEALGHVIKVSSTGEVLQSLQSADGGYAFTTGALQTADGLYISSLTEPSIGFIPSAEMPFEDSE